MFNTIKYSIWSCKMSNLKLISQVIRSIKANTILYFMIFKLSGITKKLNLFKKKGWKKIRNKLLYIIIRFLNIVYFNVNVHAMSIKDT